MTAYLRRHPASIALAVLTLVISIATGSLLGAGPRVRAVVGTGIVPVVQRHDLLSLLASALFAPDLAALLVALAAILVVVGGAERLLGPGRTLLAYVVTTVLGVLAGLGIQAAGLFVRGVWSAAPVGVVVIDPLIPVAGTALAASAFAGPLWRRRIRVLALTALVVVLLYSGQPGDAYRLAAALVGLALGALLARRRPRLEWRRSSHHEARSLIAAMVAVTALGPFVAIVSPHGYGLLRPLGLLFRDSLPDTSYLRDPCDGLRSRVICAHQIALAHLNGPGAAVLSVLVLLTLVAAAWGMWHGRRASALLAIAVNALLALLTAVYFGVLPALADPDEFVVPGRAGDGPTLQTALAAAVPAAVALLVLARIRHFDVRPERRILVRVAAATAVCFAVGATVYVAVGALLPSQFAPRGSALAALADLPQRYVPIGFLRLRRVGLVPIAQPAHFVHDWIGVLAWLAVLVGAIVLRFDTAAGPGGERDRLLRLLHVSGAGSISYMTTWTGNRTWFSPDGANAVAYREAGGVALVLGEPVGDPASTASAARAFAVDCDDRGLIPVFWAVRPAFADAMADRRRWASVVVAEDTVLRPGTFAMTGKRWQDIRTSFNRASRLGVTTVWTTWEACSIGQRVQIEAISEEWVANQGLPELGFTLGGLDELRDGDVHLMLAVDQAGQVLAATSWLPTWRNDRVVGWTLDFMRRRSATMNGLMEFVIASVLLLAQEEGLEFVSLSAAPLAASGDDDGALERALGLLARVLEPAYGFASLATFKAKFQPELQPLVLAYPDAVALPAAALALTRAYVPRLSMRETVRMVAALR